MSQPLLGHQDPGFLTVMGLVQADLRRLFRTEIGGGLGPLAGRVWRIGLMGHGARSESVTRVLTAIGGALAGIGRDVDVAAATTGCR
jgi:alanine-glyoxylate transaminase / serine-glyoxylate transaminase / serine-pyruvate transaminase